MSSSDEQIRQRHIDAWGYCPQCGKEPVEPNGVLCETCHGLVARKYHGRSQAIRFERRILNDGLEEYNIRGHD